MDKEELKKRTNAFAHRCVRLGLALPNNRLGNHIAGQLMRSSTSVASNYRSACLAQSRRHFIPKLGIVIEETDESCFWIQFLVEEKLQARTKIAPLFEEAKELTSIFIASRKTARQNN